MYSRSQSYTRRLGRDTVRTCHTLTQALPQHVYYTTRRIKSASNKLELEVEQLGLEREVG